MPGDATLHRRGGTTAVTGPEMGWQRELQVSPLSASVSSMNWKVGTLGEEGGHLPGMEKVGNGLHTSSFYFLVSWGNILRADTQKVVGAIPTVYIQCVNLFKV